MYILFLLLLPCVVSADLKAISYGVPAPAETLFPGPVPSTTVLVAHDGSDPQRKGPHGLSQIVPREPNSWIRSADVNGFDNDSTEGPVDDNDGNGYDEGDNIEEVLEDELVKDEVLHDDQYIPIGSASGKTLVKHVSGLERRTTHRGTMQINCMDAVEVCQNVGYYQNCMRAADGRSDVVLYYNGPSGSVGKPTPAEDKNRLLSGVTTDWGTPCRSWPFGQKFHDQYPFRVGSKGDKVLPGEKYVETDEWPMASMQIPGADRPVSLRCMTHTANDKGSKAWTNFRRGIGPYNPQSVPKKGKQPRPDWSVYRDKTPRQAISIGDSFYVNLNMDAFDPIGTNTDHDEIRA